jgi:hypothetical protein
MAPPAQAARPTVRPKGRTHSVPISTDGRAHAPMLAPSAPEDEPELGEMQTNPRRAHHAPQAAIPI